MISTRDITFNVVFVPGTVRHLHVLTRSVIGNCDCRFRLVSNGCTPVEDRQLQQLAGPSSRVEFYRIAADSPLRHGLVLDQLHKLETSETFAFMDSDVYATGTFLPPMLSEAGDAVGLFSGRPVWCTPEMEVVPEGFGLLKGFHNQLSDGRAVGSTYFAVYDNAALTSLIDQTGIGFEVRVWEEIPGDVRERLVQAKLEYVRYDTGKLLNVLLTMRGHQLGNAQSETLRHIGGVSLDACGGSREQSRIKQLISRYGARTTNGLRWMSGSQARQHTWQSRVSPSELEFYAKIKERRHAASRHLTSVMLALSDHQPANIDFRQQDGKLVADVGRMQQELRRLFHQQATGDPQHGSVAA